MIIRLEPAYDSAVFVVLNSIKSAMEGCMEKLTNVHELTPVLCRIQRLPAVGYQLTKFRFQRVG
jgi:hypothetical protein